MVDSCGVVVSSSRGVGERVVGVVYLLELAGACCALWGVGGDAVGVSAESCSGWVVRKMFVSEEGNGRGFTSCMHLGFVVLLLRMGFLALHLWKVSVHRLYISD